MLLEGKRIVVTGVLDEQSIAFAVARHALAEGAEIVLTSYGRARRLTERVARRLPVVPPVIEFDVSRPDDVGALTAELDERWGRVDGAVHAVAFAPPSCFGGSVIAAPWDDVATGLHVSAYSLSALTAAVRPLMRHGGSIVGIDFDARQAWPLYNWMGVAKAALEAVARYLAREVGRDGIRVNLVAAGPLRTYSARAMAGASALQEAWSARSPLGWDVSDKTPVALACVALLSHLFPATTGEIVHVDGGFHSQAL